MTTSRKPNTTDKCPDQFLTRAEFEEHLETNRKTIEKLENQLQENFQSTKSLEFNLKPLIDTLINLGVTIEDLYGKTAKLKYQVNRSKLEERKLRRRQILVHSSITVVVLVIIDILSLT